MTLYLFVSKKEDGHCGLLHPENRTRFFRKIGIAESQVVSMHLTHTNNIVRVGKKDGGKLYEDTDGLVTGEPEVFLALPVGDCPPVLFYDPDKKAIGAVHAGWRGLTSGVLQKTIKKMKNDFGSIPENIVVRIGPYICQKHYEFGPEVFDIFKDNKERILQKNGKTYVDLGGVAKDQLLQGGVSKKNLIISRKCTYEDKDFFSHRRNDSGRNLYLFGFSRKVLDTVNILMNTELWED